MILKIRKFCKFQKTFDFSTEYCLKPTTPAAWNTNRAITGCNTCILPVQNCSEEAMSVWRWWLSVVHGRNAWRPRRPRNPRAPTLRRSVSRSTAPTGFARRQRRPGWYANAKQSADTDEFSHAWHTVVSVRFVSRAPRRRSGVVTGIYRPWSYPRQDQKKKHTPSPYRSTNSSPDWTRPSIRPCVVRRWPAAAGGPTDGTRRRPP